MNDADVLVVGGGVAGGAATCALASHGLSVIVLERKRAESTVNRGEVLHRGAQALLEKWGVLDDFDRAVGARLERYRIHHERLGTVADFDQRGDIVVPHPVIEDLLVRHAEAKLGAQVRRATSARELVLEGDRVIGVRGQGPDGEIELRASLTVGADGAGSLVRERLGIECPADAYDHELCYAEAPRMEGMLGNEIFLGRHGFVMRRPIAEHRMRVTFATTRGEGAKILRLSETELADYLGLRWSGFQGWRIEREGRHVYPLARQHAATYWRPGAVLVGDAAHVNHPATGTGMHLALQDADALGIRVAGATGSVGELDASLAGYETDRRGPVAANIDRTHDVATFVMTPGRRAAWRRLTVLAAFKALRVGRKVPLLALPQFSVGQVLRAAMTRHTHGVGVYR
jgi:2-polyprenyl-6-methoxyphenol hydroxylase-like FAD-dependent oxidoreductase